MPPVLVKLVAMLMLSVQGLVAFAPGRVLCIPVQDCGTHERGVHTACGHRGCGGCGDEGSGDRCIAHEHDPFSEAMHPDDECSCHLHVSVPDSKHLPSNPRGDNSGLRHVVVPLLVAFDLIWDRESALVVVERFKPPDFSVCDQVLALKAIRLLI